MKILFAVSNDNITTSVVNKYQQKYKEIITNKNVYYFNAIIKELQKNKNYDAIVIGEDLEPISNNNYEAIDKFLFEKLDSISDEAAKPTGEDIPVILICSDRRTQADGLLIKLFGIGIYNAIIGNDRSIDTVCNLINKPRNKKEAKIYYKVESDDIAPYERGNDSDVSETEIQNILAHYRKIGTNPKKCTESFDSIAEQYNDTQLRIIIKFLPNEVKAILETNSAKFQKLVNNGTVLSNGKYVTYNKDEKNEKRDILTKDLKKTDLSKPVIIPSTINIGKKKENNSSNVNSNIDKNINKNIKQGEKRMNNMNPNFNQNNMNGQLQGSMPMQNGNQIQGNPYNNQNPYYMNNAMSNNMQAPIQNNANGMQRRTPNNMARPIQNVQNNMQAPIKNIPNNNMQGAMQNNIQNPIQNAPNNTKIPMQDIPSNRNQNIQDQGLNNMNQMKIEDNQIRPVESNNINPLENNAVKPVEFNVTQPVNLNTVNPINQMQDVTTEQSMPETTDVQPVKRGRGRPRKNPEAVVPKAVVQYDEFGNPIKRGRGRPRKQAVNTPVTESSNMPVPSGENSVTVPDSNKSIVLPESNKSMVFSENNTSTVFNDANTNAMPVIEPVKIENDIVENSNIFENDDIFGNNVSNDTKLGTEPVQNDNLFTTDLFNDAIPGFEESNDIFGNNKAQDINSVFEPVQNNDIFASSESTSQNDDSIMPGFGLDNDLENLFSLDSTSEPTFVKEDSNVMPGFEGSINNDSNDLFSSPYGNVVKTQDDIFSSATESLVNTNNASTNSANTNIIAANGKLVSFVGTSKNGTSFIVNNLAQMLSNANVKTAILDLTQNRNSYYMFTNNDQNLMQIAVNSMKELSVGKVNGVNVNRNLSVFTALPDEKIDININNVMQTLSNNFDVTLIDCDFETEVECFKNSTETYLIQTMDTFTIQPLTKFLSDLKLQNALDESKLRIVINKYVKLKKLSEKMIIGGMSKYNEPSMTLQRDLFNSQTISFVTIPFETETYARYLENIAMCEINLSGYSQNLMRGLDELKNMVYPLIGGGNKPSSNTKQGAGEERRGLFGSKKQTVEPQGSQFTSNINDTLNKMRTNNF